MLSAWSKAVLHFNLANQMNTSGEHIEFIDSELFLGQILIDSSMRPRTEAKSPLKMKSMSLKPVCFSEHEEMEQGESI